MVFISQFFWPISFLYASEQGFHPIEINLTRGFSVLTTHYLICRWYGIDLDFKNSHNLKYQFIRNVPALIQQIIYTVCFFILPIPINHTIALGGSLFVFLADYHIFGVKVNKKQAFAIVIGLIGVLLTVNG